MVVSIAARVGEQCISRWSMTEFELFLKEYGHQAMKSDTAPEDYNETYLKVVYRRLDDEDLLSMDVLLGPNNFKIVAETCCSCKK